MANATSTGAIVPPSKSTSTGASALADETILGEDPVDILSLMEEAAEGFSWLGYLLAEIHEIAARPHEATAIELVTRLLDVKRLAGMGKRLSFDLEQTIGSSADSMRHAYEEATQ
jgi:hypothetical protein